MTTIVYEVRSSIGSVLFSNEQAAQNYRRTIIEAQGLAAHGVPNHHPLNHDNVLVAPRVVLADCPNPELAAAS